MALFVACQVILSFERGVANIANESAFQVVPYQMLFQELPFRVGHLAFGTQEQWTSIQCRADLDFSRFRAGFSLFWWLLFLLLFLLFGAAGAVGGGGSVDRSGTGGRAW